MIPTGNVILAFDSDFIEKFMEEGASYQSLVKGIAGTDDRVLLFNNESNPNFVSFEHSLSPQGEPGFKITFIDPKQEFEKRFLSGGLFNRVAGSAYNKDVQSLNDYYGKKRSKEVSKSISNFDKSFYEDLARKLEENNQLKEIYVMYGTGNNLKLWSGPHKTYFTNAEISPISGGARKITMILQSTISPLFPREGVFNEIVDLNLAGMTMRCNGVSQEVVLHDYPKNVYDVASNYKKFKKLTDKIEEYKSEEETTLRESGYEKFVDLIKSVDIHSMVVDAVRNYVQSATRNKNVIVLIPNINVACREYLTHLADTFRLDSKAAIVADSAGGTGIGSLQAGLDKSIFNFPVENNKAKLEAFIGLVLTDFGMQLQKTILGEESKGFPNSAIHIYKALEEQRSSENAFSWYYNKTTFNAIITKASDKGLPNHIEKLVDVFDRIKEASKGNYSLELIIVTESQVKVLDFWSKGNGKITPSDYPTFGGYDKFNEKTEAIIVGDKGLISEYLYGFTSLEDKQKAIEKLREESVLATKEAEALNPFAYPEESFSIFEEPSQNSGFPNFGQEAFGPPAPPAPPDPLEGNFTVSASEEELLDMYYQAKFEGKVDFSKVLFSQSPDVYNHPELIRGDVLNYTEKNLAINWALMNKRLEQIGAEPSYEIPPWLQYGPTKPPPIPVTTQEYIQPSPLFNQSIVAKQDALLQQSKKLKELTLNVVPLHPVDKVILLNKTYLQSIKNIITPEPITGAGSFGDISYLPDEFAYSDVKFSQEEKNKIKQKGIPVFRYNIQNPNILDINVKISQAYTGMLNTGYSKVISRKASARVEALLPEGVGSFPITSKEDAILFLRKKQFSCGLGDEERNNIIRSMISKFDPKFVETFADTDPEKAAKIIVALLDTLEKVDHKQFIEIGQHKPSDPVNVLSEILYDLYQKCTDITIKTLPTFHLSKVATIINNPCIVLAQDIPVLQEQKVENSVLNSFIGGFYFIVGFKHTIDATGGMYSEFNLIKPVTGVGNLDE